MILLSMLANWASGNERILPNILKHLAEKYDQYCTETSSGIRGKTAQYWMNYCELMELFLLFHRSLKENDARLNAYTLHKISALFFATNHPNYAHCMTLYSLDLLNLEYSNPTVFRMLKMVVFQFAETDSSLTE